MRTWKKLPAMALCVSLGAAFLSAAAQAQQVKSPWTSQQVCQGVSATVESVKLNGEEHLNTPSWLRPALKDGDQVEVRVKYTNDSFIDTRGDASPEASQDVYVVEDPASTTNGERTILQNPGPKWESTANDIRYLGRGDMLTLTQKFTAAGNAIPSGPEVPISNSPSASPICFVSPGVTYSGSVFAQNFPSLAGILRLLFSFFVR